MGGVCDRCGATVTKRQLTQWYYRITEYAQRLLDDMSLLEHWPDKILTMQRNLIGRSEGAFVDFAVAGLDEPLRVFTTRPDTLFGTTYMVVAPESPMAARPGEPRAARGVRDVPAGGPAVHGRRADVDRATQDRCVPGRLRRPTRRPAGRSRSGPPTTCWPTTAPA